MFGQQEALAITKETEQVARYMQDKFQNLRVSGDGTDIRSPTEWSLEYLIEVDLAANIIWRSFQNQSKLSKIFPLHDSVVLTKEYRFN